MTSTCPVCSGERRVEKDVWRLGGFVSVNRICEYCDGDGVVTALCPYCEAELDDNGDCVACRDECAEQGFPYVKPRPYFRMAEVA